MGQMDSHTLLIITHMIYKITCIAAGVYSIFLGYKLFIKQIWGEAGEIESSFQNIKIIIRRAAPGSFFAIVGAVIIFSTIYDGFQGKVEDGKRNETEKVRDFEEL